MLRFTKMHGIGNDYIYVDCFNQAVTDPDQLAPEVSDRHFGVGGDGLILLLPPDDPSAADLKMRMFNADGSESQMCGNGIRCVCKLAYDRSLSRAHPMRIETGAGVLSLEYELDDAGLVATVTVDMGEPTLDAPLVPVRLKGVSSGPILDVPLAEHITVDEYCDRLAACGVDPRMTCISMGNPHVVLFCENVTSIPLESVGPLLERHPIFPERINVHFAHVRSHDHVIMRTWERGTGITLACGTGACAVCVAGALTGRTGRAVRADLPGGSLELRWDEPSNHVFMTGTATEVFTGTWRRPPLTHPEPRRTAPAHLVESAPRT